jgi:hypothetical protein
MGLHQGCFGDTRRLAGGGEADRWTNAADAVQVAIGIRDMLGDATAAVRHAIGRDDGIPDFALERSREPVPYSCKPGFELIVVHGVPSVSPHRASTLDLNRQSGFEVNLMRRGNYECAAAGARLSDVRWSSRHQSECMPTYLLIAGPEWNCGGCSVSTQT